MNIIEPQEKKSISYYIRLLHRDIGFFAIGLFAIYALSGIVLIYRDTDFLKQEIKVEKNIGANLEAFEIGKALKMREFKVTQTNGDSICFQNGYYSKKSGVAFYSTKELMFPFNRLTELHKSNSKSLAHWFTTVLGLMLFFLAISSFWMFKRGTKPFRRGLYLAGAGGILTILLLLF